MLFKLATCFLLLFVVSPNWAYGEQSEQRTGEEEYYFSVPRLSADKALTRFAKQADLSLLFPFQAVKKVKTRPLHGRYTVKDGLTQMLRGTGIIISAGLGSNGEHEDSNNNRFKHKRITALITLKKYWF